MPDLDPRTPPRPGPDDPTAPDKERRPVREPDEDDPDDPTPLPDTDPDEKGEPIDEPGGPGDRPVDT